MQHEPLSSRTRGRHLLYRFATVGLLTTAATTLSHEVATITSASAGYLALFETPHRIDARTPLSEAELNSVVGGVSADVQWPGGGPWYQSYDNLRFDVDIENHFGTSSITMLTYANNTKVGYGTVSTPAPNHLGSYHQRYDWPFPGQHDLQIKYVHEGEIYDAAGDSSLPGQSLHPDVKVHTIKFWNATSPSMSTSISPSISRGLVDSLAAAIPNRMTNVDGIFAENCATLTKTQWRFAGVGTMEISDDCMDMVASGRSNNSCRGEFYSNYDDDPANVHVVFIKRNQGNGWAGAHLISGNSYSITIRDDWENHADLDALLAHELGHTYIGGHTNEDPSANCGGPRADRNVMCSNVGRIMSAAQCNAAESSNRYQDRN